MVKTYSKLEDALDLPSMEEDPSSPATVEEMTLALDRAEEISKEFDRVNCYDRHDQEMDELAGMAIQAHKDLQELGMNVEVRHAGEIFSSSSQMLKIAVDARNLKVEKKLKLMKLQLDKMRMDRMSKSEESNTVDGTAVALDRNELLKQLKQMSGGDK